MFPGVMFGVFTFLNFFIWMQKSSGTIPLGTFFILVFLWFGISIPLVYAGAWFATKKEIAEDPVRTNKIPRQIPDQPVHEWRSEHFYGGILPFGARVHRALFHLDVHLVATILLRLWVFGVSGNYFVDHVR